VRVDGYPTHLKVWLKKAFLLRASLIVQHTEEIEYTTMHLLHITSVHDKKVQKTLF